jgi:hypothetical protein
MKAAGKRLEGTGKYMKAVGKRLEEPGRFNGSQLSVSGDPSSVFGFLIISSFANPSIHLR